jgi:predicted GNAT family N-acyltransferase
MQIITNPPGKCTPDEIDAFVALVQVGGEVQAAGLAERIVQAHSLIFLKEDNQLLGVAALKHPEANYRFGVFEKAQIKANPLDYPLELGWVYVPPAGRGRGLSHSLVQTAVNQAKGLGLFATSRADNSAMHKSILAALFARQGNEYLSKRGDYSLLLFTLESSILPRKS